MYVCISFWNSRILVPTKMSFLRKPQNLMATKRNHFTVVYIGLRSDLDEF